MFRWIDERPDMLGKIIREYVIEYNAQEALKAEAAVREAMSPHDLHLSQWYLDGKLIVTNEELQSLFHYEYEIIYVGAKFSHVKRTLKEKDNG